MFYRVAIIAAVVLLAACSDPKAASEKNFKVAIQKDLDAEYPKCYIIENFPATIPTFGGAYKKNVFNSLVSDGILLEKDEPHEVKDFWGRKSKVVIEPTFYLTDEGKNLIKSMHQKIQME
jgi:hypothetical protein